MKFWKDPYNLALAIHAIFCLLLLALALTACRPKQAEEPEITRVTVEDFVRPTPCEVVADPEPREDEPLALPVHPYHEVLAKTVYGEARGCSVTEQAAVVWCILNRVDAGYGTIIDVATAPNQFVGYVESNPVEPDILLLVQDVVVRWELEDTNSGEVGRVLPEDYLWFHGDGVENHFRNSYSGGDIWDWSLPSPYEEEKV